ncbi:hypothetical protein LCGC14_1091340 [marine sediment metagenome]|uniref:Uncharacterized protein n=1 Tax=marine sediment metagenome TaxID=412755 RepID=A0A0F9MGJ2_9ZZZZ
MRLYKLELGGLDETLEIVLDLDEIESLHPVEVKGITYTVINTKSKSLWVVKKSLNEMVRIWMETS